LNTSITAIDLSKLYLRPRLLLVLVLGFASGLPLLLTGSTLTIRLRESGIDLAAIGLFSLVGIPYSLKFLWAPLIDRLPLPILSRMLGRRRAWMLTIHIVLILAIAILGLIRPTDTSIWLIAFVAVSVAFLSATQDIAIDAYRIEILSEEEYGAGAAMAVYGFRGGMLMSTVGTLYLAEYLDWQLAYVFTSLTLFVGVFAILLAPRPKDEPTVELPSSLLSLFGETYWKPLVEFSQRDGWVILLLFVLFFKFGDALLSQMTGALFVDLNYDKSTIANVGKLFGFWAMMIGIFIGGLLVAILGLGKTLLVSGLLQGFSNIAFWRLAVIGEQQVSTGGDANISLLAWVVGIEAFTGGLGQTAFIAFLMILCDRRYTAAQFALLTSIMAFSPKVLVAPAGYLADGLGWPNFTLFTAAAAIPGMLFLLWLIVSYPSTWRAREGLKINATSH